MKNKGFTIIELLIALSISSILTGLIFAFFLCNFNSYKAMGSMSELQFQAQYILNYMADKIINSNSVSLIRSDSAIYSMTLVRNAETEYPVKKISFKFGNKSDENYVFHIANNNIRYTVGEKDIKPTAELGNFVDSMYVSLFKDDSFQNANAVKLKIVMKKDGQMYEAFQAVHMRNSGSK